MDDSNWTNLHTIYSQKDWSKVPSIFATEAIEYFPNHGELLELGAGVGQDAVYFAKMGYSVTATDLDTTAIESKLQETFMRNIITKPVDLRQPIPFADESFDVVYAHLSLHYFDHATTNQTMREIYRVLKPGGVFAVFTNSTTDPEYNKGNRLEDDYYLVDGITKRYFSVETMTDLLKDFRVVLIDNKGETYKDKAEGVHNLIRAIVKKPAEK